MRLAVSMWSYFHAWREGRLDLAGFVREAKNAGAEGVELLDFFYNDPGLPRRDTFEASELDAKRAMVFEALQHTDLPVPVFSVANNFAKVDSSERLAQYDKVAFGIDEACRYGAKIVRVFAGDVAEGITFDQARGWIVEGLAAASRHADEKGVRLALENHGKLAGRGDQVADLIGDVRSLAGNDALGANPDTGNFLLVGQASHEAIFQVANRAYMAHFKDFRLAPREHEGFSYTALDGTRYVGTAVGEGEVDLEACIRALKDAGFNGWLSVEYEGEEDPFTAVPRSIANARAILDRIA